MRRKIADYLSISRSIPLLQKGRRICGGKSVAVLSCRTKSGFASKRPPHLRRKIPPPVHSPPPISPASKRPPHLRRKINSVLVFHGATDVLQKGRRICGGKSSQANIRISHLFELQKGRRICGGKSTDHEPIVLIDTGFKKAAAFAAENPGKDVLSQVNTTGLQKGRRICGGKSKQKVKRIFETA